MGYEKCVQFKCFQSVLLKSLAILRSPHTIFAFTYRHQLSVFCILMGIKRFLLFLLAWSQVP